MRDFEIIAKITEMLAGASEADPDPKDKLRGETIMLLSTGKRRKDHCRYNGSSYVRATLASPLDMMSHCPSCEREMKKVVKAIDLIEEDDVGKWFCEDCNSVKSPMEEIPVCAEIIGEVLRIFDYSDPVVLKIQAELYGELGSMTCDTLEATIDAAGFRLAESRGLEISEGVRYRFTMFPGNLRRICGIEVLETVESG